jgi:hypothetical protein
MNHIAKEGTIIRSPLAFDVVEDEGQPFRLFAAKEYLYV